MGKPYEIHLKAKNEDWIGDTEKKLKQRGKEVDLSKYDKKRKKESSLRAGLVKLAHANPELRSDILPLLKDNVED